MFNMEERIKNFKNHFEVEQENGTIYYRFGIVKTRDAERVQRLIFKMLSQKGNEMNFFQDEEAQKLFNELAVKSLEISTDNSRFIKTDLDNLNNFFENPFMIIEINANFMAYIMHQVGNLPSFQQVRN